MVTNTGDGLNILICTSATLHGEWKSFAAWYAISQNLPHSRVVIACDRNSRNDISTMSWPFRCNTRIFQHKNYGMANRLYETYAVIKDEITSQPLLVIDDQTIAIRPFSNETLGQLNSEIKFGYSGNTWFFKNCTADNLLSSVQLFVEDISSPEIHILQATLGNGKSIKSLSGDCKDHEIAPTFARYSNICGSFNLQNWMAKYNAPPFAYAHRLKSMEMTVSQNKILDLWKKIGNLYEAIR